MIADRVLTTTERRDLDRQHALSDMLGLTTAGLPARAEQDIRTAVMRHLDPLLDLADDATVALLELAAIDRRLTNHVEAHAGCTYAVPCWRYRILQARRGRLQKRADAAYRALLAGRR